MGAVAQADEADPWIVGAEHYLAFEPKLTVMTGRETITIRPVLPRPIIDHRQELYDLHGFPKNIRVREEAEPFGRALWMKGDFQVRPGETVDWGYKSVIKTRERKLNPAWKPEGPLVLTEREIRQNQLQLYLTPTVSTGAGRTAMAWEAKQIIGDETNPVEAARHVFNAVRQKMTYERKNSFKGAAAAHDTGVGECSDYAALFVAYCRYAGIPARSMNGFVLKDFGWDLHVWAEFWVRGAGWVPCDPTQADEIADPDRLFGRVTPGHLAVTVDMDLKIPPLPEEQCRLVQQYWYTMQGPVSPTVTWSCGGSLHKDGPPPRKGPPIKGPAAKKGSVEKPTGKANGKPAKVDRPAKPAGKPLQASGGREPPEAEFVRRAVDRRGIDPPPFPPPQGGRVPTGTPGSGGGPAEPCSLEEVGGSAEPSPLEGEGGSQSEPGEGWPRSESTLEVLSDGKGPG
jgi:hypothetical protein